MSRQRDSAVDVPTIGVSIVHYRSNGMLIDLLGDLLTQQNVSLSIVVVESGDDGTVSSATERYPGAFEVHDPGLNAGYASGNNLAFELLGGPDPVLVVNPDVRIRDAGTVRHLWDELQARDDVAAVAPVIVEDGGRIEYTDSVVDRRRAVAIHTGTHVDSWPSSYPTVDVSWVDGACLLLRREAIDHVGGFDERFFLIAEEVDWCIRAAQQGWATTLTNRARVEHQRSSSFGGSTKGSYYHSRNTYLLFAKHGEGRGWRAHWVLAQLKTVIRMRPFSAARARAHARGSLHALTGRWGPAPEDSR